MNKIYMFLIISALSLYDATACDVCNIFEYSTVEQRSFIGIFYRYRMFNGYAALGQSNNMFPTRKSTLHEPEDAGFLAEKSQRDYETYHTWEIRLNHTIKNKVNLMLILPYRRNTAYYANVIDAPKPQHDSLFVSKGWGDMVLAADYMIKFDCKNGAHILRPGLAMTLPTGQFNEEVSNGELHDPILQPGSSAYAFILRLNYQYFNQINKYGFTASTNYKKSTTGENGYLFADSYNLQTNVFYQKGLGNWNLVPRLGAYFESAGSNTWNDNIQTLTGGDTVFGDIGLDINKKAVTFQAVYQMKLYEKLEGNQIGNAGRLNLGIVCNI